MTNLKKKNITGLCFAVIGTVLSYGFVSADTAVSEAKEPETVVPDNNENCETAPEPEAAKPRTFDGPYCGIFVGCTHNKRKLTAWDDGGDLFAARKKKIEEAGGNLQGPDKFTNLSKTALLDKSKYGFMAGIGGGYDHRFPDNNVVLGIGASVDFGGKNKSTKTFEQENWVTAGDRSETREIEVKAKNDGVGFSIYAKLGFVVTDDLELFLQAGGKYAKTKYHIATEDIDCVEFAESITNSKLALFFGGGIEKQVCAGDFGSLGVGLSITHCLGGNKKKSLERTIQEDFIYKLKVKGENSGTSISLFLNVHPKSMLP